MGSVTKSITNIINIIISGGILALASTRFSLQTTYVLRTEIDISVSKLLGFETFANFLRVSVSENSVSEKKSRFRFREIWSRKKVSVSENLVSEKKKSK